MPKLTTDIMNTSAAELPSTSTILCYFIGGVLLAALVIMAIRAQQQPKRENYQNGGDSGIKVKVVYFYMNGCMHCTSFSATFESLKESYASNRDVSFEKYERMAYKNKDGFPYAALMSTISGYPTVLFLDSQNQELMRSVGNTPLQSLRENLDGQLLRMNAVTNRSIKSST